MVWSCTMSTNFVWLHIIFCFCVNGTTLFSFLRSLLRENGRTVCFPKTFLKKQTLGSNDKRIIGLSVIAKYRDFLCLADQSFASADLFVTDKSRYFAQPRPIFENYSLRNFSTFRPACKNSTSTMHRSPIAHSAWSKTFIIIYIVYNHDNIFSLVIRKFGCLECFFFMEIDSVRIL